jgi:hypothetical protein
MDENDADTFMLVALLAPWVLPLILSLSLIGVGAAGIVANNHERFFSPIEAQIMNVPEWKPKGTCLSSDLVVNATYQKSTLVKQFDQYNCTSCSLVSFSEKTWRQGSAKCACASIKNTTLCPVSVIPLIAQKNTDDELVDLLLSHDKPMRKSSAVALLILGLIILVLFIIGAILKI